MLFCIIRESTILQGLILALLLTLRSVLPYFLENYNCILRVRGPFIFLLQVILPESRNSWDEFFLSFKWILLRVHTVLRCAWLLATPTDCSPPGSSVHGIFQARILVWVAISSSRRSSWPRDWNYVFYISCIGRQFLYYWATWEAPDTAVQFAKSRREVQQALGPSKWLGGERELGNRW